MAKRSKKDASLDLRLKEAARRAELSELMGPLPQKAVQPVRRTPVSPQDIVEHKVVEEFQLNGKVQRAYRVKLMGRKTGMSAYTDTIMIHASSDAEAKRHAAAAFLAAPLAMGVRVRGGDCDDEQS